jgi:N-terminal acetyltransferase B complex catalytic subunit
MAADLIAGNDLVMGKLESSPEEFQGSEHYLPWHAHITAISVSPEARRLGIGKLLTAKLEAVAEANDAWFVDLFVRRTNYKAIAFYKNMGYSVFRVVKDYYGDHSTDPTQSGEDALDMRRPMKRDVKKEHIREDGEMHEVEPHDVW